MAEFKVEDFSGGETDKWRNNNDPRFYKEAKNMYITEQRTLKKRPGLGPYSATEDPCGNQPVEKIWHHITRTSMGFASTPDYTTRYQTFVSSNGAVFVNENTDTNPESVQTAAPTPGNKLYFDNFVTQGNYIRLNENEFVVIPKNQGGDRAHAQKFYREGVDTSWKYVALGLPTFSGSLSTSKTAGTNNWAFALVLKHEYQTYEPGAGFLTKIVRSAPYFTDVIENATSVSLDMPNFDQGFPFPQPNEYFDNDGSAVGSGGNVDDNDFAFDDVVWELYRTTNNGSIYYKTFEYAPGDTAVSVETDAALISGELLYTTGGVIPNEMTNDRVQFGTFANDCLWLFSSSRGWQSKVGIYDAHPGSFNFRVREGELITGCNTIDIYPIVGTRQGIYRIEGIVDDLGNGTHRVRAISEEHGCMSNRTMVRAKNKIYFWSDDGIYETNGYQAMKVTSQYDDRYREIVNRVGDVGGDDTDIVFLADSAYDAENDRIMWVFPKEGETHSTEYLVLHLRYKNEEGYAVTSGEFADTHAVTSISAANGKFFFTTPTGCIFEEVEDKGTDGGTSEVGIPWSYVTCSLSFGTRRLTKWFTRMFINFRAFGHAIRADVREDTDESGTFRDLNGIDEDSKPSGFWLLKRWFKRGRIRGKYKQVEIRSVDGSDSDPVELVDFEIEFSSPGEGVTESDRA